MSDGSEGALAGVGGGCPRGPGDLDRACLQLVRSTRGNDNSHGPGRCDSVFLPSALAFVPFSGRHGNPARLARNILLK